MSDYLQNKIYHQLGIINDSLNYLKILIKTENLVVGNNEVLTGNDVIPFDEIIFNDNVTIVDDTEVIYGILDGALSIIGGTSIHKSLYVKNDILSDGNLILNNVDVKDMNIIGLQHIINNFITDYEYDYSKNIILNTDQILGNTLICDKLYLNSLRLNNDNSNINSKMFVFDYIYIKQINADRIINGNINIELLNFNNFNNDIYANGIIINGMIENSIKTKGNVIGMLTVKDAIIEPYMKSCKISNKFEVITLRLDLATNISGNATNNTINTDYTNVNNLYLNNLVCDIYSSAYDYNDIYSITFINYNEVLFKYIDFFTCNMRFIKMGINRCIQIENLNSFICVDNISDKIYMNIFNIKDSNDNIIGPHIYEIFNDVQFDKLVYCRETDSSNNVTWLLLVITFFEDDRIVIRRSDGLIFNLNNLYDIPRFNVIY